MHITLNFDCIDYINIVYMYAFIDILMFPKFKKKSFQEAKSQCIMCSIEISSSFINNLV